MGWAGGPGGRCGAGAGPCGGLNLQHPHTAESCGHRSERRCQQSQRPRERKSRKKKIKVFEIALHHAVGLAERSSNPPSDFSLGKQGTGDFSFCPQHGRCYSTSVRRGPPVAGAWRRGTIRCEGVVCERTAPRARPRRRPRPNPRDVWP